MVADPDYMSPININAKELVGKIPNFETAKKIVKQEMGDLAEFNQAYQKNLNRTRKVKAKEFKRKVDPEPSEKDIYK